MTQTMQRLFSFWMSWLPWKVVVSRMAKRGGFVDPVKVLLRLGAFSQPMQFKRPLELIRAGVYFHARGLLNTGAIQHNLDWVWPFWVERQYHPLDDAFIPRSFSLSHINLTHRNWTAIGVPDYDHLPIVDPRGLVTPFWDGWSLDAWLVEEGGTALFPSKLQSAHQHLDLSHRPVVVTLSQQGDMELLTRIEVIWENDTPACVMTVTAKSDRRTWLTVSLRPFNPEGVSFVHTIAYSLRRSCWTVGRRHEVYFDPAVDRHQFCYYRQGDVSAHLFAKPSAPSVICKVGMATAAAMYAIHSGTARRVRVTVPLRRIPGRAGRVLHPVSWNAALKGAVCARLPEKRFQQLFDTALRTLVLHSPGEVYPGPYTYKRFWFRDAAFILYALCCAGLFDRVQRALNRYPGHQTPSGFFRSQEGEWDANGEALWIMSRFCELSGRSPPQSWQTAISRGAQWILNKRLPDKIPDLHAGLLPAGFSAEHLGPNDYYFWDNFWSVAGLEAAANLLDRLGDDKADRFKAHARRYLTVIEQCIARVQHRIGHAGIPASVYRRMDSGAIGSLVAGYPLQLFGPTDRRLIQTATFLLENCLVRGGFFLDIIHSGINPYLTLHLAQVLMRSGEDYQYLDLVRTVAQQASPTGQWPEAIHPRTLGGCMGDGNHAWAAAEWIMIIRNSFVREEADRLVIGSGLFPEWCRQQQEMTFGPAPTVFGPVSIWAKPGPQALEVGWEGVWRTLAPSIEVAVPGFKTVIANAGDRAVTLFRKGGR